MYLDDSIEKISGIGEKTKGLYNKLGVFLVGQLLNYYPKDYILYEKPVDIENVVIGERNSIFVQVVTNIKTKKIGKLIINSIDVRDKTGIVTINWFNSPYIKNIIRKGDFFVFVGYIKKYFGSLVMDFPEYYSKDKYKEKLFHLQPIYSLKKGLTNNLIQKHIKYIVNNISQKDDFLPKEIIEKYNLFDNWKALFKIHFPENKEQLLKAIDRVAFNEFYIFINNVEKLKKDNLKTKNKFVINQKESCDDFINKLPFNLTNKQINAIDDILIDMSGDSVMNRLVEGDVGSGKTIVAIIALYGVVKEGFQGALMVPTEVLAKQHYKELVCFFSSYNIRVECLVGSLSLKEKREIYNKLSKGEIDILIGTHAVIQEKVEFSNLALVITDEQHRFGVNQREKLEKKGDSPHVLVMSATPIPRTLGIILYADLDISIIDELPKGRMPIKNCVIGKENISGVYKCINQELNNKSQVYVICPMIEEGIDLELNDVINYTENLKKYIPESATIKYLHGKMSNLEKNNIMEEFINKKIDILVSTTVIEVGINNPNATLMIIENAERFGLAQLHQLRGRVGRGDKQSYCVFVDNKKSKQTKERLDILEKSNDGFKIAAYDLKLRGAGDFFGIRQSGEMLFKIADIYNNKEMLKLAQEIHLNYFDIIKKDIFDCYKLENKTIL